MIKDKTDKNKRNQQYVRMTLEKRETYTFIIIKWQVKRNAKNGSQVIEKGNEELRIYQEKYHCINDFFIFLSKTVSSNDTLDGSQLKLTEMPWLWCRVVVVELDFSIPDFPHILLRLPPKQSQLLNSIKW